MVSDPLLRNSLHLIASTFVTSALGFIFWIIATRLTTPADVGLASTLISSMNLLVILALFGFNASIIRFLPGSEQKNDLLNTAFSITIVSVLGVSLLFLAGIPQLVPSLEGIFKNVLSYGVFILFTVLWMITTLFSTIFIAVRRSKLVLIKETIFGAGKVVALVPLVPFGAIGIYSSWGIGILAGIMSGVVFLKKFLPHYRWKFRINRDLLQEVLSYSFSNYISWVLGYLPPLALTLIITGYLGPQSTAFFYIAWMIANLLFTIPLQTSQALFAEGSTDEKKLTDNVLRSIWLIVPLLLLGIVAFIVLGSPILRIFGPQYPQEGLWLLQILALSSLPYAVNVVFLAVEKIRKNNASIVLVNFALAAITLPGSILFMNLYGLNGTGIAWFLANILVTIGILVHKRQFVRGVLSRGIIRDSAWAG